MRLRMVIESGREQHVRADVHRRPPEFGEQIAFDANILDPLGVFRLGDRCDDLAEADVNDLIRRGIEVNMHRFAVEVAGFAEPVLTFTLVGSDLQSVAIGAMESFVSVENRLDAIVAGGNIRDTFQWLSQNLCINYGRLAWCESVNVEPEAWLDIG